MHNFKQNNKKYLIVESTHSAHSRGAQRVNDEPVKVLNLLVFVYFILK